jgi:hypothetical protein
MAESMFRQHKSESVAGALLASLLALAGSSGCDDDDRAAVDATVPLEASVQLDAAQLDAAVPVDPCSISDAAARQPPRVMLGESSDAGAFFGTTIVRGSLTTDGGTYEFVDGFAYADPTLGNVPRKPSLTLALSTSPVPHCQRAALDGDNQSGLMVVVYTGPGSPSFAATRTPECPGDGWTGLLIGDLAANKLTLTQGSADGGSQVIGSVDLFNQYARNAPLGTIDFQLDFCGTLDTARF